MIRYLSRPEQGRLAFERRAANHRRSLDALATDSGTPDYAAIAVYISENEIWGSGVKEHYTEHQGRTCAYCERKLTDYGDVEHYRPKTAVFALEPGKHGTERASLSNIQGRRFSTEAALGARASAYWWLAYDWDNLFVACQMCNRAWKNALFPVTNARPQHPTPASAAEEGPLLLDPYGEIDPTAHLAFNDFGAVEALNGSALGQATIDTVGLWRQSVASSRREKAARTFLLALTAVAADHNLSLDLGRSTIGGDLQQVVGACLGRRTSLEINLRNHGPPLWTSPPLEWEQAGGPPPPGQSISEDDRHVANVASMLRALNERMASAVRLDPEIAWSPLVAHDKHRIVHTSRSGLLHTCKLENTTNSEASVRLDWGRHCRPASKTCRRSTVSCGTRGTTSTNS